MILWHILYCDKYCNLFQCLITLIIKNFFLISNLNLPSRSWKPLPLVLSLQALVKSLSVFLISPLYITTGHNKFSLESSPGWETPTLSAFLHTRVGPSLWSFLWPSSGPTLTNPCLSCTWDPRAGHWTPGGVSQEQSRGAESPPLDMLAILPFMQPGRWFDFCIASAHCQHTSSFSPTSIYPQVLLHRATLNLVILQSVLMLVIPTPMCRTLHLALLNFLRFTWAHSSSLSRSLWMASLPSSKSIASLSLVSFANLLRMHSIPVSMSLIKILNSIGCSIDPWGKLLTTSFHFGIELL